MVTEQTPRAGDDHGEWSIRIYDDQPVPDGKKYAPENRVVILRNETQVRDFLYPAYRIWTLLAHWTEGLAALAEELEPLADDGQANTCTHQSATGIDTTPIGPGKVWRCDHCGLRWTDS